MRLVFFTHPLFMKSQSMPRFAKLLSTGMQQLGHQVELWHPQPVFYNIPAPAFIKKWLGYIDQYIVFPIKAQINIRKLSADTLFVFTDQALGPWIPLVTDRPHVIHCHDFLAQRSALGEIPENPTGRSGILYQKYIYKGYRQGLNFISVSKKTQEDLHRFLDTRPIKSSAVVYNGLNQDFKLKDVHSSRQTISNYAQRALTDGYILHVGGNQWYKNRKDVIEIYDAWRSKYPQNTLPLLLVGATPTAALQEIHSRSLYKKDILFLTGLSDEDVQAAYAGAQAFLFPSLAEGFGWPIAEAMASGCPVITMDAAPMSEVSGDAAFLLPVPASLSKEEWLTVSASILNRLVHLSENERMDVIQKGLQQIKKFNTDSMIASMEKIYKEIILSK